MVKNALAAGKVIAAGNADETNQVYANHSYTVMSVTNLNGTWCITLRNPWGYDGGNTWGDPDDGVISMTWNSFQGYNDFDRISIS